MTLRIKILSITIVTFVFALGLLYTGSQFIILGGFTHLENENINTNINRAKEAVNNEFEKMTTTCGDWAPWDETGNP